MEEVFLISTARTPIGSLQGALASIPCTRLGARAIQAAVERAGIDPSEVEEVFMGNVITSGEGQAPANQASIYAGLPDRIPCTTVNKVCASGMKAIVLAAQGIRLGDIRLAVAGGMESMSNTPYYLDKARAGYRLGNGVLTDGILRDGLWDPYHDFHMGNAAELCAAKYRITREDQDAFALESYRRVREATEQGFFSAEIVPVETGGKQPVTVSRDEEYQKLQAGKIPLLKPAFDKDGTITAANASKINDGAAAVVLCGQARAKDLGLKPVARIVSYADASQAPEWFTTTPTIAMNRALKNAALQMKDMDYAEINEAFSCVAIANARDLGIDPSRLNIWGGAVALGHPIGCSGARILVTLVSILKRNHGRYGIAGICNGGGGASAVIVEAL
ncbi:MAG TPA: acetyl-CoA C-acyltransferase [Chitinophagaceae bacterium]|nr:acetyl-CoA C-acyltransferase [Chitinophagaceae bacterium]